MAIQLSTDVNALVSVIKTAQTKYYICIRNAGVPCYIRINALFAQQYAERYNVEIQIAIVPEDLIIF